MSEKIKNINLVNAGLELMAQNDMPLVEKVAHTRKAMIYKMGDGTTVRLRTSNDHILPVVTKDVTTVDPEAPINIEGTDWLLIIMPEIERTHGNILAYLVPTDVAVTAAKGGYRAWLDSANIHEAKGNRSRNLWFGDPSSRPSYDGRCDYAEEWKEYLLPGHFETTPDIEVSNPDTLPFNPDQSLQDIIQEAQQNIATVAGVRTDNVKISIDFTSL